MPTVARFNVTSVKSTALDHPDDITLNIDGVEGDREFLFTEADGRRISAGGKAPLLGIRARHDRQAERLTLELPDGKRVEADARATGDRMRVPLYDREIWARVVEGRLAPAVSSYVGRELVLARTEPPDRAGGTLPVSIVSLASVAELGRRSGRGEVPDPRRFRMLIEIDDCPAHEEDTWSGRRIQIGKAIVRVGGGVPRCLLTNLDPDSGEPDFPTLHVLAGYRKEGTDLLFGVYGEVERPGTIRVGDTVELLDERVAASPA